MDGNAITAPCWFPRVLRWKANPRGDATAWVAEDFASLFYKGSDGYWPRDVALRLNADVRIGRYAVDVENFESIHNHSAYARIERELMLVKVRAAGKDREEMKRMADIFRGRIIDVTDSTYVIELTGNGSKLDAFLEAIDRALILETVRTGVSGIGRGDRILKV